MRGPGGRKRPRSDGADAFITEEQVHRGRVRDDLAEMMGEQFVEGVTEGLVAEEDFNRPDLGEVGGPFVESGPNQEFAHMGRRGRRALRLDRPPASEDVRFVSDDQGLIAALSTNPEDAEREPDELDELTGDGADEP